jgi:hypothetical protein
VRSRRRLGHAHLAANGGGGPAAGRDTADGARSEAAQQRAPGSQVGGFAGAPNALHWRSPSPNGTIAGDL